MSSVAQPQPQGTPPQIPQVVTQHHRGTKALEFWCKRATLGYRNVTIENMTSSWRNGLGFCALIHHFRPDLIDYHSLRPENIFENNATAFKVAEQQLGIPALLDAEDMVKTEVPDRLSILTYVAQYYQAFNSQGLIGPGGRRSPLAEKNANAQNNKSISTTKSPVNVAINSQNASDLSNKAKEEAKKGSESSPKVVVKAALIVAPLKPERLSFARNISQPPSSLQTKKELDFKTDKVPVVGPRRLEVCVTCHNPVFLAQRLMVTGQLYHRTCFKCARCSGQLTLASYYETEKGQFCCETCPDEEIVRGEMREYMKSKKVSRDKLDGVAMDVSGSEDSESDSESSDDSQSEKSSIRKEDHRSPSLSKMETSVSQKPSYPETPKARTIFLQDTLTSKPKCTSEIIDKEVSQVDDVLELCKEESETASPDNSKMESQQHKIITDESILPNNNKISTTESSSIRSNKESSILLNDDNEETLESSILTDEAKLEEASTSLHSSNLKLDFSEIQTSEITTESISNTATQDITDGNCVADIPFPDESFNTKDDILPPKDGFIENKPSNIVLSRIKIFEQSSNESTDHEAKNSILSTKCTDIKENFASLSISSDTGDVILRKPEVPDQSIPSIRLEEIAESKTETPETDISFENENKHLENEEILKGELEHKIIDDSKEAQAESEIYPDDLNPFGDEEEKGEAQEVESIHNSINEEKEKSQKTILKSADLLSEEEASPRKVVKVNLNPFGDSDSDIEDDNSSLVQDGSNSTKTSLNPFGSDEDYDDGVNLSPSKAKLKPPRPPPPTLKRNTAAPYTLNCPSSPSPSCKSTNSEPSALRLKKKLRLAPLPPGEDGKRMPLSAGNTPAKSQRSSSSDRASGRNVEEGVSVKTQKELINNTTKRIGEEAMKEGSSSMMVSKNEAGQWRRKKGPAPSRPIPQKRALKKLPMQQVQMELHDIDVKQTELERQGVLLETIIREKSEGGEENEGNNEESPTTSITSSVSVPPGAEVEDLILQLFELVNEKNELFRRQTELMYLKREARLEEEYADLEYQIRCLMLKAPSERTPEDLEQEEDLIGRLVKVVEMRDQVVSCLDMERQREAVEDNAIAKEMIRYQEKHIEGLDTGEEDGEIQKKKKKKKLKLIKRKKKEKDKEKSTKVDVDKDVDEMECAKEKKKKKWFKKPDILKN